MDFDDILPTYEGVADYWNVARDQSLYEAEVLAEALAGQRDAKVLDLGCGSGAPIAAWFHNQGAAVTGVDGAVAMINHFKRNLPDCEAVHADMRQLNLGRKFDVILAWDSFFHLSHEAQRGMFTVFARHAAQGARLLFTSGDENGTVMGAVNNAPVIHASFKPEDYRQMLLQAGFTPKWFRPQDKQLWGRSAWLAIYDPPGGIE